MRGCSNSGLEGASLSVEHGQREYQLLSLASSWKVQFALQLLAQKGSLTFSVPYPSIFSIHIPDRPSTAACLGSRAQLVALE